MKHKYDPSRDSIWQHPDHGAALEDHLRYLIAQGLSSELIGERLGVSRSSVISKAHRLGIAHWTPTIRLRHGPQSATHRVAGKRTHATPPPAPLLKLPPKSISSEKLTNETCRFPMWADDDLSQPQLFCGVNQADLAKGKPYCAAHSALCFVPHSDRPRNKSARPW